MNKMAIVVPCYNEEEVLKDTNEVLLSLVKDLIKKKKVSPSSFILYVDDGSKDNTWNIITDFHNASKNVYGLKLAGNKGHQNALFAGLMYAKDEADFTISIDADLQDDVGVIEEMIDKYHEGYDIVYGVRDDRTTDTGFKRGTANLFYKIMKMLGSKAIENAADFRLISSRVLEELSLYSESNLYLRGIIPELGFKSTVVYYSRKERTKGETKYPLKKMIDLAINGVTSFSDKPLLYIVYVGIACVIVSFISFIVAIIKAIAKTAVPGWGSIFCSMWLLAGILLIAIGIVGIYVGRTYTETKKRPRYYIETYLNHKKEKK